MRLSVFQGKAQARIKTVLVEGAIRGVAVAKLHLTT